MAGYSGAPLARKLGIKEGHEVVVVDAPKGFAKTLEPLPAGTRVGSRRSGSKKLDVVLAFVKTRATLSAAFEAWTSEMDEAGGFWVAWPKKSSGVATELTEDVLRELLLPTGWVDNKVCAVDEIWSGLRFVKRKENRRGAKV